jgi:hypothetical protein
MSKKFNMLLLSLALTAGSIAGSVAAYADAPDEAKQAEIHFANSGGIFNWQAAGNQALYIEARDHRWYLARLLSPCLDLPFTEHVGFETEANGDFDRFGAILVGHEHCKVISLVESDKPGSKQK